MSALFRTGTAKGQSGVFNSKYKAMRSAVRQLNAKKRASTSLPRGVATAVRKIVKKEMDKDTEDKYYQAQLLYQIIFTDAVTAPAAALNLSLTGLAQGTDSGQRVGDRVKITKAFLNLAVIQNGGAVVIPPTLVSVYVARPKATPISSPTPANYNALKQNWAAPGTFSKEQTDQPNTFYTLVNYNAWDVAYHETCLIGLAQPSVATGVGTNNDSVIYKELKVDLTKFYKGPTVFDGNVPQNNTWFLFAFAYEINAAPTVGAVYPLIRGEMNFMYEDA